MDDQSKEFKSEYKITVSGALFCRAIVQISEIAQRPVRPMRIFLVKSCLVKAMQYVLVRNRLNFWFRAVQKLSPD